jgi:hypothetical protein
MWRTVTMFCGPAASTIAMLRRTGKARLAWEASGRGQPSHIVADRVTAAIQDCLGDFGLAAHRTDGDERAGQGEAFEQERDGGDLVGLGLTGLLAEHETLAAGPG